MSSTERRAAAAAAILGLALALGAGAGCGPSPQTPAPPPNDADARPVTPADLGPDAARDAAALADASNRFAFDLYGRLRGREGNLFFSPYSLSSALAMTYAGARGETARQMAAVLHLPAEADRVHRGQAALRAAFVAPGKPYELAVANRLWGQKGYRFLPGFLGLLKTHYGAGLLELDFAAPEAARLAINADVARTTHDRISDLVPPGVIDPDTRLVLTSALYFKAAWADPFEAHLTRDEPFYLAPETAVAVPMMRQAEPFGYLDGGDFQALQMPYRGGDLAMVFLLPKARDGLADLEKALSGEWIRARLARLKDGFVHVVIPKFRTKAAFSLAETLGGMGMPAAFDGRADFGGMDGGGGLYLTAVVHEAFVTVDEEGTEAGAATAEAFAGKDAEGPLEFRADRPFLFLIRDVRSGCILFLGRVADPRG